MKSKMLTIFMLNIFIGFPSFIYSAESKNVKSSALNTENQYMPINNIVIGRMFNNKTINEKADDCDNLLRELGEGKNIKYIDPITSDSHSSKDFKPNNLFEQCPDYNNLIWYPQIIRNEIYEATKKNGTLSGEKKKIFDQHKTIYKSSSRELLYRVDINNDPTDGVEYVFHGSGFYSEEYTLKNKDNNDPGYGYLKSFSSDAGKFYVIDKNSCSKSHIVSVHDPYNYSTGRELSNYNGIIQYKDKYYIYDLYETSSRINKLNHKKRYNLKIYEANNKTFVEMCKFYEKH